MLIPPSSNEFKARFPRFVAVDDGAVTGALDRAATQVDETWSVLDRDEAMFLYAAHQLTLDGLGTGVEAQLAAEGAAGLKMMRTGSLTIERFDAGSASAGGLDATGYGTRFMALLRANRGGARVTGIY